MIAVLPEMILFGSCMPSGHCCENCMPNRGDLDLSPIDTVSSLTCGGGSSNAPAPLSVRLSPSAPSLAVNSSVLISAQTTPSLPKYFGWLTWSIQGYPSINDCSEVLFDPQTAPPMSGCPNGWLAVEQPQTGYTPTGVSRVLKCDDRGCENAGRMRRTGGGTRGGAGGAGAAFQPKSSRYVPHHVGVAKGL